MKKMQTVSVFLAYKLKINFIPVEILTHEFLIQQLKILIQLHEFLIQQLKILVQPQNIRNPFNFISKTQ